MRRFRTAPEEKRMSRFVIAAVAAAAALVPTAFAAAGSSANGSGHIVFASNRESVSFNAVEGTANAGSGQAEVHDITAGVRAHIDVNCVNVVGSVATISGIVTKSSDPTLVGFEGIFQVVDGGSTGEDLMSLVNFHAVGTGSDCRFPGEFDLVPLQHGEIHVNE
jgi:hypothetical protein